MTTASEPIVSAGTHRFVWRGHETGKIAPRISEAGRFSSPHGLAAAPDGTIYVAEWRIGGRLVTLTPTN